jgi:hypothetical protein
MNDMTNDYDKLRAMKACASALQWIGDCTIEQAWSECERSDWMCWLLRKIAPNDQRCRLTAADFAERVWHLIPDEPTKLAAAWAIGAARRGDRDEMDAAYATAAYAATYATAASYAATYAAAYATAAAYAAAYAANSAVYACASAYDAAAERAKQADILRQYFSAREVGDLFRRTPA